jgi:hypothetical protein
VITDYYLNMDGKLLPALVDRKLIDMMPDLITMEHVHLDACILLIYYCILWQGCFFLNTSSCKSPDRRYARQIFICCLRTIPIWKQESSGSVTDFIAAMYMVRASSWMPVRSNPKLTPGSSRADPNGRGKL